MIDDMKRLSEQYLAAKKTAIEGIADPEQRKVALDIFNKLDAAMKNPTNVDTSKMMEELSAQALAAFK